LIKYINESDAALQQQEGYRTLGHLVKVNYEDKDLFIEYLTERLGVLSESYVSVPITQIIFTYVIKKGKCPDEKRTLLINKLSNNLISGEGSTQVFNNMQLPLTINPEEYGTIIAIDNSNPEFTRFIVIGKGYKFIMD
jgi:hypothetical protein